jgi:hypothetical protein
MYLLILMTNKYESEIVGFFMSNTQELVNSFSFLDQVLYIEKEIFLNESLANNLYCVNE